MSQGLLSSLIPEYEDSSAYYNRIFHGCFPKLHVDASIQLQRTGFPDRVCVSERKNSQQFRWPKVLDVLCTKMSVLLTKFRVEQAANLIIDHEIPVILILRTVPSQGLAFVSLNTDPTRKKNQGFCCLANIIRNEMFLWSIYIFYMLFRHCDCSPHCLQSYHCHHPPHSRTSLQSTFAFSFYGQMKPSVSRDSIWTIRKVDDYSKELGSGQ